MKKKMLYITIAMSLAFTMIGCGGVDEQSQACLQSIKIGLQNRWDIVNTEYSSYEECEKNILEGIEAELQAIEAYKDIEFEDVEFDAVIDNYIQALNNQKEGQAYVFIDAEKYNDLYYDRGYKVRSECINILHTKYGLEVDSTYKDSFEELLDGAYTHMLAPNEQVVVNTEYGEVGVSFTDFDVLKNPAGEKELVLYCEIENISYWDDYNGESLITDYFIGVYDEEGYHVDIKGECYDYISGYEETAGYVDLAQGEKGKFAIMCDYVEDIDIIYVVVAGIDKSYGCYLTAGDWLPDKEIKYAEGSALTQEDSLVYVENEDRIKNYGNDVWTMMKNEYGEGSFIYYYHDDGDATGIDDIGDMRTYRNIVLGESSEDDVVKAYGFGESQIFNLSTDPLYSTLIYYDTPEQKFLLDTEKVIFYDYNDLYQIAFYIDEQGMVDFIAYFDGECY